MILTIVNKRVDLLGGIEIDLREVFREPICPVCKKDLFFNSDYSLVNCEESSCKFNHSVDAFFDLDKQLENIKKLVEDTDMTKLHAQYQQLAIGMFGKEMYDYIYKGTRANK